MGGNPNLFPITPLVTLFSKERIKLTVLFRVDVGRGIVGVPVEQGTAVLRRRSSRRNRHMPTLQTRTSRFLFPSSQASLSLRGPEWHPRPCCERAERRSGTGRRRGEGGGVKVPHERAGERCGERRVARDRRGTEGGRNDGRWRRAALGLRKVGFKKGSFSMHIYLEFCSVH